MLLPHLLKCEFEMMRRIARLDDEVSNKQELRYAIGDPILDMICNTGDFVVCFIELCVNNGPLCWNFFHMHIDPAGRDSRRPTVCPRLCP